MNLEALRAHFSRAPKRWTAGIALALLFAYALYLSVSVVTAFEARRWDLPAHVYAAPLELHVGLALAVDDVATSLAQTGYQSVATVTRPGEYHLESENIDLWTRPFQFWDAYEPAQNVIIEISSGRIAAMRNASNQPVPLLRLEPMRLGSLFASHHEDRILVEPDGIPQLLMDSLTAIEDRKFERHHGLDFAAILRAAWVNLRSGEIRQGGSTLTQQLVKNYFLDRRQTLGRKIREAIMAVALEARYDKADILHAYVNEIYLGQQGARAIHGFGLASEFYFAKRLEQLELHEIALLVALVKGPSYYDPRRHADRAKRRRDWVLSMLVERDVIDAEAAIVASKKELGVSGGIRAVSRYQPAYMDLVRSQLAADYPLDELATQGLRVFTSLDPQVQSRAERQLASGLERLQPDRDDASPPLEGAVIITRPQSGEIVAMVGGRDVEFDGFNRALNAKRPVGSLIKPVVYLAALQSGDYTLATQIDDAPIDVLLDNGDTWAPQNFDKESHGEVPLLRALAASYNQATVRLGMAIGVDAVADLLQDLGLDHRPQPFPSLLLGALDLSPLEVANVYNSLANGGFRTPLRAVQSVIDATGQPLMRYPLQLRPAANVAAVQQLNSALVQVIERGTGRPARLALPEQLVAAGKTGTSDEFRDSWFAGFTNDYLAVVWVGRDDNTPVGLTGSTGALGIWAQIVAGLPGSNSYSPPVSPALDPVWLDYASGFATREGCGDSVLVLLPAKSKVPRLAGCSSGLGARARHWLQNIGK